VTARDGSIASCARLPIGRFGATGTYGNAAGMEADADPGRRPASTWSVTWRARSTLHLTMSCWVERWALYRAALRQYVPAIEELSSAGWDPLTFAHVDGGVAVERFGTFEAGELHFTLHNYSEQPVDTVLRLDSLRARHPGRRRIVVAHILPHVAQHDVFAATGACRCTWTPTARWRSGLGHARKR